MPLDGLVVAGAELGFSGASSLLLESLIAGTGRVLDEFLRAERVQIWSTVLKLVIPLA